MKIFSSSLASVRKIFKDTFNRTDQTGLGLASDGSTWNETRSGIDIVGNKATASIPANYPMSVINMPTKNNEISLFDITQGAAVSMWVTDSGNWWTVGIVQEPTDCNCQTCTNCEAYSGETCIQYGITSYNPYNYGYVGTNPVFYSIFFYNPANYGVTGYNPANYGIVGGQNARHGITGGGNPRYSRPSKNTWSISGYNPYTYTINGYNPANYGIVGGQNAKHGQTGGENAVTGGPFGGNDVYGITGGGDAVYSCTASNPNECISQFTYDCNCQTCYPQYIRILQSVGSTVSTITSWLIGTVTNSTIIQSLNVKTNGEQITVKAYSDTNQVSQIGDDLVYTATGATITSNYGISLTPSSYNQGYSIGEIEIKRS